MYEEKTSTSIKKCIENSILTGTQIADLGATKKVLDEVANVINKLNARLSKECEICSNGFCYICGPKVIEAMISIENNQDAFFFIVLEKRIRIAFAMEEEENIRVLIKLQKNAQPRKNKYAIEKQITTEILKIIKQHGNNSKDQQKKYNLDCLIRNQIIDTQNYLLTLLMSHLNQIKKGQTLSPDTVKSIDHVLHFSSSILKDGFPDVSDDMCNLKYVDTIMNAKIDLSTRNIIKSGISLVPSARACFIGTKRIYITNSMPGVYWRNGEWHKFVNDKIEDTPNSPKYVDLDQYEEVATGLNRVFVREHKKTYEIYDPILQIKQMVDK